MLQVALVRASLPCLSAQLVLFDPTRLAYSVLSWRPREPLNDFNELMVCSATGVAKLFDFMFVREPVQAHQLASALAYLIAARMADR